MIYLGMRVEEPRGLDTLETLGPQIRAAVDEEPDGLLLHEEITFSEDPPHVGMRQYWRDFDSLEAWSLTLPHKKWWTDYLRDRGGTSFWHETYFRSRGFESVYVDVGDPVGLGRIAPSAPAKGRCSPRAGGGTPTWLSAGRPRACALSARRSRAARRR